MRIPQSRPRHGHLRRGFAKPSLAVVLLTVFALAGSGCTSLHPIPLVTTGAPAATVGIKPGDDVRVTMRDGRKAQFTVESVEASTVIARGGTRYAIDEMTTLERRSFSGAKTAGLIALVGGAAFLVLLEIAAAEGALVSGCC